MDSKHPSKTPKPSGPGNLFEDWLLFQNIVARNYLQHHEIIKVLRKWSKNHGIDGMRILDLGCGDSYVAQKAFKAFDDVQYYGIDVSGHALNIARANFEPYNWNVELLEGDITNMIQQLHGPFDLVIAGYSLHHLTEAQQANALDHTRMVLNPMGTLIIYDLMPNRAEKINTFTDRLIADAVSDWKFLDPEQIESFKQHLKQTACPMSQATWQMHALESALGRAELIYRDEAEHVGVLKF